MSEEAIRIAADYMRKIAPRFESSILKLLFAYAERSGQQLT